MDFITLRGHHLVNLCVYFFDRTEALKQEKQAKLDYGVEFSQHVKEIFDKIFKNRETFIMIVDTFDTICSKCPRRRETCESKAPIGDQDTIKFYGLEKEKIYVARDLICILEKVENPRYPLLY